MNRIARAVWLACLWAGAFSAPGAAQKAAGVAGRWDVTIRMPDRTVTEQWTIQQKGKLVTATVKSGRGELPAAGSFDGNFLRVTVKDGEQEYKVRATLDGDELDGSITQGVGKEYLWQAKRAKTR